jgi:N-methylhydantoinase B/oxoprolinase/acetone carboxylase alpha subunit
VNPATAAATARTDAFTAEILRSYLVSTVREMVITTTRTAFSTCFCHGEDFTCGMFDAGGRMVAQDQGVGVHAGGLEGAIASVLRRADGDIQPGDVYLHNDPYDGGTHQADVCAVRPIFAAGRLLGFAANRGHWSDVGGMAPGGWSGEARDVIQEALLLPSVRLYRAGVLERDIKEVVLRNVRATEQCWGDLQAQIASNISAERRIQALVERHGVAGFEAACDAAVAYSRRRFLAALEVLPDGVGHGTDVLEDDARGNGPFPITVALEKTADGIVADFTGTHPQIPAPINCSYACTRAAVIGSVIAVIDPGIPLNAGVTALIDVRAPKGSMVNPVYPAPCFGTTADPADRTMETVLRALGELAPEQIIAGSYSSGQNVTAGTVDADGNEVLWYSYQSGGTGSWEGGDGNNAEWHLMANSKNESMEAWETRYPVAFEWYRFVEDSGGAGRWRGGLGTERALRVLAPTTISAISDHHFTGARGLSGGEEGWPNGFAIVRDGVRRSVQEWFELPSPSKFSNRQLAAGDVFVTTQGGGGGCGEARERDPEAVAADVRGGYVSAEVATGVYGWRE